jgi:hypothetical protein
MMNRIGFVAPRFAAVALAAIVLALVSPCVRVASAVDCPPRVHLDPATNERCGRDHYESAAAAQRCVYADQVARMSPEERDECEIDDKGAPKHTHATLGGNDYGIR